MLAEIGIGVSGSSTTKSFPDSVADFLFKANILHYPLAYNLFKCQVSAATGALFDLNGSLQDSASPFMMRRAYT